MAYKIGMTYFHGLFLPMEFRDMILCYPSIANWKDGISGDSENDGDSRSVSFNENFKSINPHLLGRDI